MGDREREKKTADKFNIYNDTHFHSRLGVELTNPSNIVCNKRARDLLTIET